MREHMNIEQQSEFIAKFMHEVEKQELHSFRRHYAANVLERMIHINGQRFMVQRLAWQMTDGQYRHEYQVYVPVSGFGAGYSTVQFVEGWGVWDGMYGDITSYFQDGQFAHLKSWSWERSAVVQAYYAIQNAVSAEIAHIAFAEDFQEVN